MGDKPSSRKLTFRLTFAHEELHGLTLDVSGGDADETVAAFADLAVAVGRFANQFKSTLKTPGDEAIEETLNVEVSG